MAKGKKIRIFLAVVLIFMAVGSPRILGDESMTLPEGFENIGDALPDDAKDALPDKILSDDLSSVAEGVEEFLDFSNVMSVIGDGFRESLSGGLRLFTLLSALILLSSLMNTFGEQLGDSLSGIFRVCGIGAVFCGILGTIYSNITEVQRALESINSLMLCMVPILGATLAMGGNISGAAGGSASLYTFITVSENLCARSVLPITVIVASAALCMGIVPEIKLGRAVGALKKGYAIFLGFIMTLLLTLLSANSQISAAADGITAKAVKLASSTAIPIVGGSLGETLRTVAASVGYIKSIVGVGGIIFLLALTLSPLISLIVTRVVFLLASTLADMLGCEAESGFLAELGGIFGCLIAVLSMTSVMFILALFIFIKIAVAAG